MHIDVPGSTIRVAVVDDYNLYRRGVSTVLDLEPGMTVVGEAESAAQALELVAREQPDVVLLDIYLPDGSGLAACAQIKQIAPGCQVLMITASDDGDDLAQAIEAGATGYLLKDVGPDHLVAAIRGAYKQETQLSPALGATMMDRYTQLVRSRGSLPPGPAGPPPPPAAVGRAPEEDSAHSSLTERELEVLGLLGLGMSNRAVADELYISENTVKNHVRRILEKLGVESRVQAATYAARHGLVEAVLGDAVVHEPDR